MNYFGLNPYLPLTEHVPDGEPRLFEDRVYIYGSHDRANGTSFCQEDYVTWSASIHDLTDWRYEGVIYRKEQDPLNPEGRLALFAPDVVQGTDGKYYLYYCLQIQPVISVAISDSPSGPFEFLDHVHRPDGRLLKEFMPYDPAVLVDDDGQVFLYYGFSAVFISEKYGVPISPGSMMVKLAPDMVTALTEPEPMIPWEGRAAGTEFEAHPFFEASSIRKIHGKYYLVYSSKWFRELCYAISDHPDRGFHYGGVIVDNTDIGMNGRTEPACATGTNHGGLVDLGDKVYIFYHRHTNGTSYSRQGCAEEVRIEADGSIRQVEITSCGLNGGPLPATGEWPAAICCWLYGDFSPLFHKHMNEYNREEIACIAQDGDEVYIRNMMTNTTACFKYFRFDSPVNVTLWLRGRASGTVSLRLDDADSSPVASSGVSLFSDHWKTITLPVCMTGTHSLLVTYQGEGAVDFLKLVFTKNE